MYGRWVADRLARDFKKPFVHILFGARQTEKTTLRESLITGEKARFIN